MDAQTLKGIVKEAVKEALAELQLSPQPHSQVQDVEWDAPTSVAQRITAGGVVRVSTHQLAKARREGELTLGQHWELANDVDSSQGRRFLYNFGECQRYFLDKLR